MKKKRKKIVLIAGGGTGGHLFPALAIGNGLKNKNIMVRYIGSKFGIENIFFNNSNYKYNLINIKGIQRSQSFKSFFINLSFPLRFVIAYFQSLKIILINKPSVVIGTGGYCSGLPLLVANHLKIPTIIQDQNSVPGLITRKLKNKINKIFLAYESASKILNSKNCIVTGNPLRNDLKIENNIDSKIIFNLDINKKTILILGGSQGSLPINEHLIKNINTYIKNDIQILWQCGNKNYKRISKIIDSPSVIVKPFINNMSEAYTASDLVISRAGAITISELTFMHKAMILIPLPSSADNHQFNNAQYLLNKNACVVIQQKDLNKGILEKTVMNLFNNESELENLKKKSGEVAKPNATTDIIREILDTIS